MPLNTKWIKLSCGHLRTAFKATITQARNGKPISWWCSHCGATRLMVEDELDETPGCP